MKKDLRKTPQNAIGDRLIHVHREVQGPIPDPVTLEHYNSILPGAAERILVMAEQSAQHARDMDKDILQAQLTVEKQNHAEVITGQILGILSALAAFGVALFAIHMNHPTIAGIVCSTTVVGLVTVFVLGRKAGMKQSPGQGK